LNSVPLTAAAAVRVLIRRAAALSMKEINQSPDKLKPGCLFGATGGSMAKTRSTRKPRDALIGEAQRDAAVFTGPHPVPQAQDLIGESRNPGLGSRAGHLHLSFDLGDDNIRSQCCVRRLRNQGFRVIVSTKDTARPSQIA